MVNIPEYLSEVKSELSKVTWPKRREVTKLTAIVIFISVVVGLYLGGLDFFFTKLLETIVVR